MTHSSAAFIASPHPDMGSRPLRAWLPWLVVAALCLLWAWLLYVLTGCVVGFQMAYRPLCGAYLPIAILVIPVPVIGTLGFVLGRWFGRREKAQR